MAFDPSKYEPVGTVQGEEQAAPPAQVAQGQMPSAPPPSAPAPPPMLAAPAPTDQMAAPTAAPAKKFNPANYEALPDYANGMSDVTPLTKSPLTPDDRLALGYGNEGGKLSYLKKKFEDVKISKDGDFVIKQNGLWHQVDGSNFGDADAWKATKGIIRSVGAFTFGAMGQKGIMDALAKDGGVAQEIVGDAMQAAPAAAAIGASVAAGAMTGGASVAAQALAAGGTAGAVELARTSLGRLEGTYDATPEQQAKEIAFESIFNAAGVPIFEKGIKPTAALIGKNLEPLAKGLKAIGSGGTSAIKSIYGKLSVGTDAIDELLENTTGVRAAMARISALSGGKDSTYAQVAARSNITLVKEASEHADSMLKETWDRGEAQLARALPANFSADASAISGDVYEMLMGKGLVGIQQAGQKGFMSAAEAAEAAAMNGGKAPKGMRFALKSREDVIKMMNAGGLDATDAALVDEVYQGLEEVTKALQGIDGSVALRGEKGVKQMLGFQKTLGDLTYKLEQRGVDEKINGLAKSMVEINDVIKGTVSKQFEKYGAKEAYEAVNANYSAIRQPLSDLINASGQAAKSGSDAPFESLANRLGTRAGKSEALKGGFDQALAVGRQYGISSAEKFAAAQRGIRANNAAVSFNPWVAPGLMGKGMATFAAGAAATGNFAPAALAAGTTAVSSPRVAYGTTLAVNALWDGKQLMEKLGADGARRLWTSPEARNAFLKTIGSAPELQEQVTNQLLSPLQGGQ